MGIAENAFKPYACIALGKQVKAEEVERIELTVNPYVLELTGKPTRPTGLAGNFSVYHTGAVAFLEGDAGEAQYSDASVHNPEVVAFRSKIHPKVDARAKEEEVYAVAYLKDGSTIEHNVKNATGSIENPMDDAALAKFNRLMHPIIGEEQASTLWEAMYKLDEQKSLAGLIVLTKGKRQR